MAWDCIGLSYGAQYTSVDLNFDDQVTLTVAPTLTWNSHVGGHEKVPFVPYSSLVRSQEGAPNLSEPFSMCCIVAGDKQTLCMMNRMER